VLVTGGAGFIGRRTADALAGAGYEVRILDSLEAPVHPTPEWPAGMPRRFECIQGDVRSRQDWSKALRGVNAVIHLAAYQDYLPDFSNFVHTNAAGTALLYEVIVAERLPIQRVVVASSQAVYGEGSYQCPEHGLQHPDARPASRLRHAQWEIPCAVCAADMVPLPVTEDTVNPQNAYGISKLSQELMALHLGRRYDIPTVALRYSITQGAGQSFHNAYSGICRIFAMCALLRKPFPVYEDGLQQRDYVYVGDIVAANLLALTDARMNYRAFNVGGTEAVTVRDYAALVQGSAGVELPLEARPRYRVGDTRHIVSDSSKLQALGWQPTTLLPAIISEYLGWAGAQRLPDGITEAAEARMQSLGAVRSAA
jgi:dTDP-L-rhamnose 4-epimerase